jgi:hypothetical protein
MSLAGSNKAQKPGDQVVQTMLTVLTQTVSIVRWCAQ